MGKYTEALEIMNECNRHSGYTLSIIDLINMDARGPGWSTVGRRSTDMFKRPVRIVVPSQGSAKNAASMFDHISPFAGEQVVTVDQLLREDASILRGGATGLRDGGPLIPDNHFLEMLSAEIQDERKQRMDIFNGTSQTNK